MNKNLIFANTYLKLKNKINNSQNKYFKNYVVNFENNLTIYDVIIFLLGFILLKFILLIIIRYVFDIDLYETISPIINQIFWIAFLFFIFFRVRWKAKHIYIFCLAQIGIPILNSFIGYILSLVMNSITSIDINQKTHLIQIIGIYLSILAKVGIIVIFYIFIPDFKLWFKKAFSKTKFNILITLGLIVIGYLIMFALQIGLSQISSLLGSKGSSNNQNSLESIAKTIEGTIALFLSAVIIAPIYEEVIYRYYLLYLSKDSIFGVFASILLFALAHVEATGDFENIFPYFSLGIVSGFIYWYFKNLTPSIFIHFISNLIAFIILIVKIY